MLAHILLVGHPVGNGDIPHLGSNSRLESQGSVGDSISKVLALQEWEPEFNPHNPQFKKTQHGGDSYL